MIKTSTFANLISFRNGGGSVPSIGGTVSLEAALADVARCERALEAARSQARGAARREGVNTRYLFDGHPFVARSSAERWVDDARAEGVKAGCDLVVRGLTLAEDPPFQHLAKRLKREGVPHPGEMRRHWARLDAAGFLEASRSGDYELAAQICIEVHREEAGKVTGERILAAGRRARMSGSDERPLPEKGSFASRVIEAGKRRRGEI